MNFQWKETVDQFNTATLQLMCNKNVLVEAVQYEDGPVQIFNSLDFIEFGSGYFDDLESAKKEIERALHEFCVEFNTWWQR